MVRAKIQIRTPAIRRLARAVSGCSPRRLTAPVSTAWKRTSTMRRTIRVARKMTTIANRPGIARSAPVPNFQSRPTR
jgi:hypothetical protein